VATRLVTDELDLDLSTLAAGLLVIVIVILGSCSARALSATSQLRDVGRGGSAIADGVGVVEVGGGGLVVLVGDVCHGVCDNKGKASTIDLFFFFVLVGLAVLYHHQRGQEDL
jgi:hypothetical protein